MGSKATFAAAEPTLKTTLKESEAQMHRHRRSSNCRVPVCHALRTTARKWQKPLRALAAPLLLPFILTGCISTGVAAIRYAEREADPLVQAEMAELDFARLAQTEGQWTAFRATAAPDALMFVPQPVNAHQWLAGRADPPRSVAWQPHRIYVSCDGRTAATTGAAQWPGGSHGMFTTIWQKQPDGNWKWVADHGAPVSAALVLPPEPIRIRADCHPDVTTQPPSLRRDTVDVSGTGASADGSLSWAWVVRPNGALRFVVDVRQDGCLTRVIDDGAGGA